jgi:hypothetical protein
MELVRKRSANKSRMNTGNPTSVFCGTCFPNPNPEKTKMK